MGGLTPTQGIYSWSVPYTLTTTAKIRITDAGNSSTGSSGNRQSDSGGNSANSDSQNARGARSSSDASSNTRSTGTQGGTHEQHVEAGKQSHKNSK